MSHLEALPVAVLRDEMRDGFEAASRRFEAMDARFEAIDRRFEAVEHRLETVERRLEIVEHRLEAVEHRLDALERRMEEGFEETRRYMRVLYEDLVTRIATIGEATPRQRRKPRPS